MDVRDLSPRSSYILAPCVYYDDYDEIGYLLDIRHGVLMELNERDTFLLSAVLGRASLTKVRDSHLSQSNRENLEMECTVLLERLTGQKLLKQQARCPPSASLCVVKSSSLTHHNSEEELCPHSSSVTLRQRLVSATHILFVLNELRQGDKGFYKAHQYIQTLRERWEGTGIKTLLSDEAACQRARSEYWFYRLITGFIERRVAHLLGQVPGDEGLCMIRAFALCAFLLSLGVSTQIVIARPKYGSRSGYKIHVWVEMQGKPLNERPNVRDAYRVMVAFPL